MATGPGACDRPTSQSVYGPIFFPRCFCAYVETIKYSTQCNLYDISDTGTGALLLDHAPERSAALQLKLRLRIWDAAPCLKTLHKRPHLGD